MIAPRRFLPSISSLLALEALERLGSVNAAAADLSLTHSAISRQLKILQDQIGVELFHRRGKGVVLTRPGSDYAHSVRDCLQDLAKASLKVRAAGAKLSLDLAIKPAFGMTWLAPRLRDFSRLHQDITINLSTRLGSVDFRRDGFDAALHFGLRDWPDVDYLPLATESVIPVCSPMLLDGDQMPTIEDLLRLPLLHLENRPGAWEQWFESHGFQAMGLRGMLFDQFSTMAEAAALGFGVALLPDFLAKKQIADGRLVAAWKDYALSQGVYHLVWPSNRKAEKPLELLNELLRRETKNAPKCP